MKFGDFTRMLKPAFGPLKSLVALSFIAPYLLFTKDLTTDIEDWNRKLNNDERYFISHILGKYREVVKFF